MVEEAKKNDPEGQYYTIKSGDLSKFEDDSFDLILSAFVFDSVYSKEEMIKISKEIKRILKKGGIIINITSTPEIYSHNWASFLGDFLENKNAKSGDKVKIVIRDTNIVVFDYIWTDKDYQEIFTEAGLSIVKTYLPLAKADDSRKWYKEREIAPWFIYVLK